MPNKVGGYNPGEPATVTEESVRYALSEGYVVAAPGARARPRITAGLPPASWT